MNAARSGEENMILICLHSFLIGNQIGAKCIFGEFTVTGRFVFIAERFPICPIAIAGIGQTLWKD